MGDAFQGRGWKFPIVPDETGALGWVEGQANIEQSLKVLLLTALGDRVMRPDFGTEAPRIVFAPGSEQHLRQLEGTVRAAVRDFEPRVELLDVSAEAATPDPLTQPAPDEAAAAAHVTVSISYRVRRTNSRFNLVFPFYVGTVELA